MLTQQMVENNNFSTCLNFNMIELQELKPGGSCVNYSDYVTQAVFIPFHSSGKK